MLTNGCTEHRHSRQSPEAERAAIQISIYYISVSARFVKRYCIPYSSFFCILFPLGPHRDDQNLKEVCVSVYNGKVLGVQEISEEEAREIEEYREADKLLDLEAKGKESDVCIKLGVLFHAKSVH